MGFDVALSVCNGDLTPDQVAGLKAVTREVSEQTMALLGESE